MKGNGIECIEQMFNRIIAGRLLLVKKIIRRVVSVTPFLPDCCIMLLMKKGRIKEEEIAKISITAKKLDDEYDDFVKIYLKKLMAKKKRGGSN